MKVCLKVFTWQQLKKTATYYKKLVNQCQYAIMAHRYIITNLYGDKAQVLACYCSY